MKNNKEVLVIGATGNVGGATTRELLKRNWVVRAMTRNPESEKAMTLTELGAEVIQGDMEDKNSLVAAFKGMKRVFSVQNPWISDNEREIKQGKLVAEVAKELGVEHLVYSSAGDGEDGTGVPHFQNKVEIETHMKKLGLNFTVLRPGPFMELMINKKFFPPMVTWGAEPKVLGWDTPKPWVAVRDIGVAVANIFENPQKWIGQEVTLFGDVKTLTECRVAYIFHNGKKPFGIPIPVWLFKKMVGEEMVLMWIWLKNIVNEQGPEEFEKTVETSRELCPDILNIDQWMELKFGAGNKPTYPATTT